MYTGDSRTDIIYNSNSFKTVAAHEFGHTLGIKDGYNDAITKQYNSIMCDQWGQYNGIGKASNLDIQKMLKALKTKNAQKW